jgi:hypothetical protein
MTSKKHNKFVPAPCSICAYRGACGGVSEGPRLLGCWDRCIAANRCAQEDWVCPCKGDYFHNRVQEVNSLEPQSMKILHSVQERLPLYIPKLHHASRRRRPANLPFVAVSTYDTFAYKGTCYQQKFSTGAELREAFRVVPSTKILFISVGPDSRLERYWQNRRAMAAPTFLAQMGAVAITAPNFSYFDDGPRTQTLYNARRTHICVEELTDAGLPVVLHLNSETETDWLRWTHVLREQPQILYVAKEFETGKRYRYKGLKALDRLRRLQDDVGHALHPIIIGGTQYSIDAARAFDRLTFVDSTPAMRTSHHKRAVRGEDGRISWEPNRTLKGKPLDCLLELNVRTYSEWLMDTVSEARASFSQLSLDLGEPLNSFEDSGRISLPIAAFNVSLPDATCPHCRISGDPERDFGFRIINGRRIRQSWCRRCRRRSKGS